MNNPYTLLFAFGAFIFCGAPQQAYSPHAHTKTDLKQTRTYKVFAGKLHFGDAREKIANIQAVPHTIEMKFIATPEMNQVFDFFGHG